MFFATCFHQTIFFCAKNIFSSHLATFATGSANPASCAYKTPMVNVDRRTNDPNNGNLHAQVTHAKAGATIKWLYHRVMYPKDAVGMANCVDPGETAPLF